MNTKKLSRLISICLIFSSTVTGQLIQINEMVASNATGLQDPDNSEYTDWVELKNNRSSSVDISGYYLTDSDYDSLTSSMDTTKWAFPSSTIIPGNGFLLVYADGSDEGVHTNFKLSSSGEELRLFSPNKELLDSLTMPEQVADISYGRKSDNSWAYLEYPTPNSVNDETATSESLIHAPGFSPESGVFSSGVSDEITTSTGATIYYTTDGSDPTEHSSIYKGSISVNSPLVIRAVAMAKGKPTSAISSHSYIVNVNHDLPIVSLTPDNYDTITVPSGAYQKINIDGKVRIDFYEDTGDLGFSQYADFKASGNSSENLPQLNGKVYAKEKYGNKFFNYKMYPNKDLDSLRCFVLRNASQDFGFGVGTHLRDGLVSRIISEDNLIDMPFEAYRPAVLYVNGIYEGIINIREDDDKYYAKHNYSQDMSDYQKELTSFSSGIDIKDPANHAAYEKFINVRHSYFHQAMMGYIGQGEEGARIWRDSVTNSQFQYHMHDYDQAFMFGDEYVYNSLGMVGIAYYSESHKQEMLQFYAAQLNLLYDSTRTLAILEDVKSAIESEIPNHAAKNKSSWSTMGAFESLNEWNTNIETIRSALRNRPANLWSAVKSDYSLTTAKLTHEVNDTTLGTIAIHGVISTEKSESGDYFTGMPIRLRAVPKPGYNFLRWEGISNSTSDSISVNFTGDSSIKAIFDRNGTTSSEKLSKTEVRLAVNSISQKAVSLTIPQDGQYTIKIYGLNGRLLFSRSLDLQIGLTSIPLTQSNFAKGVVLTEVSGVKHSIVRKLVIK